MEPNHQRSPRGIIITILLIIIVGILAYFIGKNSISITQTPQNTQEGTTTQATTTANTEPTQEQVKTWKTYTYAGIEYKYPLDWKAIANVYTTPAGVSDQVGVSFYPVDADITRNANKVITINGHQTDCSSLKNSPEYTCITLFDKTPEVAWIYTSSKDPEVLKVLGSIAHNATDIVSESWKSYTNTSLNYQINYPRDLVINTNKVYPPDPGSTVKGIVFSFPKSYYQGGTISSVDIGIVATKNDCSLTVSGEPWQSKAEQPTSSGQVFNLRKLSDAGAGNYYLTTEYSLMRNGQCYRIGLLTHGTNPGNTYNDQKTIEAVAKLNDQVEQNVESVLDKMVASFAFTK
jgi:hypothetical protein